MSGPLLLCVDIGNLRTTVGLLADGEVLDHWQLGSDPGRTPDEWSVLLRGLLAGAGSLPRGEAPHGVAVCSTVPVVLREWRVMLGRVFPGLEPVVVGPGVRTGLPVLTENPREVGADRVMNALACAARHPLPAVVVDVGFATTFDVVSERGEYLGGVIAPGVELSLDALARRGAQLRAVELRRPRTVVARNTVEAIQSGAVHGVAAQVDGIVARIAAERGWPLENLTVVVTGEQGDLVRHECTTPTHHEPWLSLLGLENVWHRQQ